jgi:hypothetical protein
MPAYERRDSLPAVLPRDASSENIDAIIARGKALWHSIYEPHAVKLHDKLASYHPDLICTSPFFLPLRRPKRKEQVHMHSVSTNLAHTSSSRS